MTMNQYIPFKLIDVNDHVPQVYRDHSDAWIECSCGWGDFGASGEEWLEHITAVKKEQETRSKPEPEPIPKVKSCNRHFDCKEAEEVYYGKHPKEPRGYIPNFHCHDDECEDCFGC